MTQETPLVDLLARDRVLRHVPPDALRRLVRGAAIRRAAERDALFTQGDDGTSVMAVIDGYVKLSAATPGGREVVLEIAGPGCVFGELAVLNGWPRAADATALTAARLLAIDGHIFRAALEATPAALIEVARIVSERLARTTERLTDAADLPAGARLAKALIELAALRPEPTPAGLRVALGLSQRELGAMTGLTRESINKHLAAWREQDWVRPDGDGLVLVNPRALRDLTEGGRGADRDG